MNLHAALLSMLGVSQGAFAAVAAGLTFGLVGLAIFLWGLSYVRLDRAIAQWPKVRATVTASRYASSTGAARNAHGYDVTSTTFVPAVEFQYTLDEKIFTGTQVTRAVEPTSDGESVKRILDRYPVGARVEAFYDPTNPAVAYLEVGRSTGARVLMVFGGVFLAASVGTMSLVLLAR
jgi:Protein of unknown function (DUF3592)